ncbi:MAG TPA: serine/threonine-protein kinase, partial [Myxococcota bacterium]|nr:serine/threonine-protein kinase [Myxococcota bacterium]
MNWICSHCGEKFSRFRTRCPSDGQRVIEDLSGQLIGGRYRIRELIGVGGMDSTVWKAWQTGTERVVAVKVLPAAEEAAAKRFARGARIAANLNHPNCTVVHDYGRSEDGKLFLVMEFLAGQVLQEILGPEGMGVADAMHVADQVLQALEHAHGQRAVHRDLKPDNLFLCRKNDDPLHVKILDFGIAKYVEEDPENTASEETPEKDDFEDLVTEQRQVCGTPQYMAPEQVVGARIDGRTDLYSLGCVMYRMLTGRLPFDGKTRYELYQKHLQEAPRPFTEVRPDLVFPERLEL